MIDRVLGSVLEKDPFGFAVPNGVFFQACAVNPDLVQPWVATPKAAHAHTKPNRSAHGGLRANGPHFVGGEAPLTQHLSAGEGRADVRAALCHRNAHPKLFLWRRNNEKKTV